MPPSPRPIYLLLSFGAEDLQIRCEPFRQGKQTFASMARADDSLNSSAWGVDFAIVGHCPVRAVGRFAAGRAPLKARESSQPQGASRRVAMMRGAPLRGQGVTNVLRLAGGGPWADYMNAVYRKLPQRSVSA